MCWGIKEADLKLIPEESESGSIRGGLLLDCMACGGELEELYDVAHANAVEISCCPEGCGDLCKEGDTDTVISEAINDARDGVDGRNADEDDVTEVVEVELMKGLLMMLLKGG